MLKGFKNFIMQGNVIDLAVAVVIGTAFAAVINALVANVLMPLISALVGAPNFDSFAVLTLNGNQIQFGVLLTQVVNFLLIAAAIYFVVVVPMNKMIEARNRRHGAPEEAEDESVTLLKQIRDQLTAQTERVNPEAFAAAVAADREAAEAARAAEQAQQQKDSSLRGKAKNLLWGSD